MNYRPNRSDAWRRSAAFEDKMLNRAIPGDLHIEQPTAFKLVVNVKTAKALGNATVLSAPGSARPWGFFCQIQA
jgi:hypothetical protein